jgi:hypothetical protein
MYVAFSSYDADIANVNKSQQFSGSCGGRFQLESIRLTKTLNSVVHADQPRTGKGYQYDRSHNPSTDDGCAISVETPLGIPPWARAFFEEEIGFRHCGTHWGLQFVSIQAYLNWGAANGLGFKPRRYGASR